MHGDMGARIALAGFRSDHSCSGAAPAGGLGRFDAPVRPLAPASPATDAAPAPASPLPPLGPQPHEFDIVVRNFPPRSLESVIQLRNTLLTYADTYPVRWGCLGCAQPAGRPAGRSGGLPAHGGRRLRQPQLLPLCQGRSCERGLCYLSLRAAEGAAPSRLSGCDLRSRAPMPAPSFAPTAAAAAAVLPPFQPRRSRARRPSC